MWYGDNSIANIFSLANLVNKYRAAYDSHKDDTFTVCENRGILKFSINKKFLYVFNPTYTIENSNVVTTVEENI